MNVYTGCEFKIGDKVVVVIALPAFEGTYKNGDVGVIDEISHKLHGYVLREDGYRMNVYWEEVEPYEEKEVNVENTLTAESLRKSILSLQQERVSLQEKIEQNIAQEKSLTEQLKELGFLLVETKGQPTNVVDETKTVLYAEDIEEDMTDHYNWKVGDVITGESGYSFDGKPVKIRNILYQGESFECTKEFDLGDTFKYHFSAEDSKFLYRPIVN